MGKTLLRLLTILLIASMCLGFFSACSKDEDFDTVTMPSDLSTREKFAWGTERFSQKLLSQLQNSPVSNPLGVSSAGGTTETSLKLSGDDQLAELDDARINATSTYDPEKKANGIYYEFEDFLGNDFEFGVYLIDNYLYITSDDNLFDSFRLKIDENFNLGEQLLQAINAIFEEVNGDSLPFDIDSLKSEINAAYERVITEDCYSEEDGSVFVNSETLQTQRIIFRLDESQIYQLSFDIIQIFKNALEAPTSAVSPSDGDDDVQTDDVDNITSDSEPVSSLQTGYYTDGYELYYFDGNLWSYFDDSYNLWIGYDEDMYSDVSYLSSEFQSEYSSEYDAFEYMGYFGYYYSEGYYQDTYGDWYYLSGGSDEIKAGWYYYDGEWSFWRYTYVWEDVETYYPQYNSEIDVPEFEIAQEIYSEHGYYQDSYGYIYYHNPDDSDWYSYDDYSGWYYFTDAYFWDDLIFLAEEYPRGSEFPPFGQDQLSSYREKGYYTDGIYYYYCDDYDGEWYYFIEPTMILAGNDSSYGWQYYAQYYSYEDLEYLGSSIDQVPEFDGIGSGTDNYLEVQLKEMTNGAEIEFTLDFYNNDLVALNFSMDFSSLSCELDSVLWNSGVENIFEFGFDAKSGGQNFSMDLSNSLYKGSQADYEGDFRFSVDADGDTLTIKGDTEVNLDKNFAEVLSDFKIKSGSTSIGNGSYTLTQSISKSGTATSEIELDLSLDIDGEQGSIRFSGTSETDPLATEIEIIGWQNSDYTFENLEELFTHLFSSLDEINYY